MEHERATAYRFGPFLLEPAERRLTKGSVPIDLTVKAFDLLILLIQRNGQLVTKDEIFASIWTDVAVTESNVTTTISVIRKALGDDEEQNYITTVHKKGYRFTAAVESVSDKSVPITVARPRSLLKMKTVATGGLLVVVAIAGMIGLRRHNRPPADPAQSLLRRAIEQEKAGNDMLALESLDEALRLRPDFDDANVKAAWIAYQDDDDDRAAKYIQSVMARKIVPEPALFSESAHRRCTRLKTEAIDFLLRGGFDNSLRKMRLATEADPSDIDAVYYFLDLTTTMGLLDEADQAASKCRTLDGRNPFCILGSITLRVYQNRFDDAVSEYDQAQRAGVTFPWLDGPVGFAKLGQGDLEGARQHFRALQDSGGRMNSTVHFRAAQEGTAGRALYQGQFEDARSQIIAALDTSTSNYDKASYHMYLAQIEEIQGGIKEARKDVQSALRLSPSDDLAIDAARTLALIGDYEPAREVLTSHSDAAGRLGRQYAAVDRLVHSGPEKDSQAEGLTALADAYRYDQSPELAYFLAQGKMRAGAYEQAIVLLHGILNAKGKILIDGIPSLLPLTENNLAICYERLGNGTEAAKHRSVVKIMWKDADPDVKNLISLH